MIIYNLPLIMLKCLVLTIIIEIVIASLLKVNDKKDLLNIALVNIVTNPIVTSVPVYFNIRYGILQRNIVLYTLEVLTVITEGLIYKKVLKYKKINPIVLSLILNLSSYGIGEIINRF